MTTRGTGGGLIEAKQAQAQAETARSEAVSARQEMEVALRTAESATSFTVDLFKASSPREHPAGELSARDLLDRGLEQVEALEEGPKVEGRLLETLGDVSFALGDYERAGDLFGQALGTQEGKHSVGATEVRRRAGLLRRLGAVHRERFDPGPCLRPARRSRPRLQNLRAGDCLPRLGGVDARGSGP